MPPRYAYWTILVDNKPTAFRARESDELLPTLNQLKRKNTDAVMKWFARGRLWDSPEAERIAARQPKVVERRGKEWRPGGRHEDPRAKFARKKKPDVSRDPTFEREREPWRDKPAAAPQGARQQDRSSSNRPATPSTAKRPWRDKPGTTAGRRPWSGKAPAGAPRESRPWNTHDRTTRTPPKPEPPDRS